MNLIKTTSALALALAVTLPTATLAGTVNQRDSSLDSAPQATTASSGFTVSRHGIYVDQRDPSLSDDSDAVFSGFAMAERGSQTARFDGEAARAHERALEH